MIIVYEAKSSIDANIVQDILSIEGINSHIMGGFLEGGIGEIQTMGVIKLMVDETDYEQARSIITTWEKQHPIQQQEPDPLTHIAEENIRQAEQAMNIKSSRYNKTLLTLIIAIAVLVFYFVSPNVIN